MADPLNRVLVGIHDRHARAMEVIRILENRERLIKGFIERFNEGGRETPRSTLVLIEDTINGYYDEPKVVHLDGEATEKQVAAAQAHSPRGRTAGRSASEELGEGSPGSSGEAEEGA